MTLINPIFTIGHSTHTGDAFLELLNKHNIDVVADVRSFPHSRFNPQFSKENLESNLRKHRIRYVFLGKELGGRPQDPSCYVKGQVLYERIAQTPLFRAGIERVKKGANKYRIVLMCAEKDPINCHRTLLVARYLAEEGAQVIHIHPDGNLEPHEVAMSRLAKLLNTPEESLFQFKDEIAAAIAKQEKRIAYRTSHTA
ncbi:MAG: DUF488 domain-containing protein [Methylacidiphilales bacterium]|nr:DUF488 domain-containing protein [Candidatus Methylacidiphilales bacterium]